VTEALFRPRRCGGREGALLLTFLADGTTASGIELRHDERKFHNLALVLDVSAGFNCADVEPGDSVLFAEGQAEPLVTAAGDHLFWAAEEDVLDVFEVVR
jgi:co-chaperonin GroES (HSP10)